MRTFQRKLFAMHAASLKKLAVLASAAMLALAGCAGEDGTDGAVGPTGPTGPAGQDLTAAAKPESCVVCHGGVGAEHQAIYNQYTDTSVLAATINSVVSTPQGTTPETYNVVVTFSLTKNGQPYAPAVSALAQKTVYVTQYNPATGQFMPSTSLATVAATATPGQYTARNNTGATPPVYVAFAPESSNAMVYAYFAENPTLIPPKGNYKLYDNVASVAQAFGTLDYVSAANVSGCERCHGTPYMKHGYRAGTVPGIPDMAACKACHYDNRNGNHRDWQLLVDDPATYAACTANTPSTCSTDAAHWADYAYTANVMNDVHMSHAMEFAYPQAMANCVTCHEGKLGTILADANFQVATCKSCHPVTGVGGTDPKRAPALAPILAAAAYNHAGIDLYTYTGDCSTCHSTAGIAPTFGQIHTGYSTVIYANETTKHSAGFTTAIDSASFAAATNTLTANFSVTGAAANALVKPTVVVSLYGYDTKDFIVSGHGSQPDNTRNLEWVEASTRNSPRLTVAPATATAGNTAWVATADLTLWAAKLADGSVKRCEIGILPVVGADQTQAVGTTNPAIAVSGVARTFDLVGNALVADADSYGKAIVDTAKCNKCHDALGTTFHSPAYGSASVVACRLCHVVGSGGSHLEMQSRSIDSYVHAIHSFQAFDIGDIDFAAPVQAMHYEHHIESTYPNFTRLNCESCHNPGMYDVPDQSRSLVGVLSASDPVTGRAIGTIPSYVTGPASRACGGCHRATMINEDAAGELVSFNEHTGTFGTLLENATGVFEAAVAKIMSFF